MKPTVALFLAVLAGPACLAAPPAWWTAFTTAPRLEARFTQESESAVFGKLKRAGTLRLAKGGRLRVEYRQGLLLVADGRQFYQYDPQARTAQKADLRGAAKDAPLLAVLLDPGTLEQVFKVREEAGRVLLEPRKAGLPKVTVEGRGGLPGRISWTDPTGARQVLDLQDAKVPAKPFGESTFSFQAPAGTRWLDLSR